MPETLPSRVDEPIADPQFASLDLMLKAQLQADNAPESVLQKWNEFVSEVVAWKRGK